MPQRNFRRAARRFEMMIWPATSAELMNPTPSSEGTVATVFYIRNDESGVPQVYGEAPSDAKVINDDSG